MGLLKLLLTSRRTTVRAYALVRDARVPLRLKLIALAAGSIDPSPVFTHKLPLGESPQGYSAMDERVAIKVCLEISAP